SPPWSSGSPSNQSALEARGCCDRPRVSRLHLDPLSSTPSSVLFGPFSPCSTDQRCHGVSASEAVGYAVVAYVRTPARAEALIAAGVCLADTAASIAATSDMVFTVVDDLRKIMVGNPGDVRAVGGGAAHKKVPGGRCMQNCRLWRRS
uniref:6-phosphogluconate dehydrogenase NADP-binding domain-containing protein n=1 Tax=Aegilops tauschii subsp. strangulata TaxID=200361 RepID=A0A453CUC9_AEGTS